ncbi:MAG: cytochrome P450 [Rhodospirillales bacterium]
MVATTQAMDTAGAAAARAFDLLAIPQSFLDDPYPTYALLRRHDPVHRNPDGSYFLTRYRDIVQVYRDPRMSSDKTVEFRPKFGDGPLYEHHTTSLVFNDPPLHTRVRKLLAAAFTPRALAALEPRVVALVDGLLDAAEARGEFDLIGDFASALPVELICDMLGVPRPDRGPLREWAQIILSALEPVTTPVMVDAGDRAVADFSDYLRRLIAERRRRPSNDAADILGTLAFGEIDGERLTEPELIHNCIFLLNAGHETTTNLIGNGVAALLDHPGERARLAADPGLIRSAVEEFLRYESSNQLGNRRVAEDAEVGGVALPAGTYIHIGIGAANRDPEEFPDPDRLDIGRAPNRHLAFGSGAHACLGMSLARIEGRVAIGALVARFPDLRPAGTPIRGGRARFRGYSAYPVAA